MLEYLSAFKIMAALLGAGFLFGLGVRLTLEIWPNPTNITILFKDDDS